MQLLVEKTHKKVVIVGIPGVGKTSLVTAIVEKLSDTGIAVSVHSYGTLMFDEAKSFGVKDRDELSVVADQFGRPSPAKDIAKTLIILAEQYQKEKTLEWGTYHYCGDEKVSWCGFAKEILKQSKEQGLIEKAIKVNAITTADYQDPTKRPANSMLDCEKIKNTFGMEMPSWKESLNQVLTELK